jgi:flagellar operon protein (TIGR03826 family)
MEIINTLPGRGRFIMDLDNCPRCGKLFAKNFREVCPACIKQIDLEYQVCSEFLRKNRGATITEVSESTDVSVKQITKFIREGRISLIGAPNLSYPCEVCGTLIRENSMCINCRSRLVQEVNKTKEQQQLNSDKPAASPSTAYRIGERIRDRF